MTDSILIVGGGVAGLTAAIECATAGARVTVVEQKAIVGGRLAAAMTDDTSTGGSIDGIRVPTFAMLAQQSNIELMTLAELESIQGRSGNFEVAIRERARFVDDSCTRCNRCRAVCPSVSANEFDAGLTYRKAIFTPLPQTVPPEYVIDIDSCLNKPPNYLPCNRCIEVCDDDSIHFDFPLDTLHERHVGAIILALGFDIGGDSRLKEYGYGTHPDIVTTVELQRLLMSPGPTGGFVAKPSNEEYPESILLILDELTELAAYTAGSLIHQLVEQDIGKITLLITTQPDTNEKPELLHELPASIDVCWGLLQKVEGGPSNKISASYADFASSRIPMDDYDMVVLDPDLRPAGTLKHLAQLAEITLDADGYVAQPNAETPNATSCPGIYLAGSTGGPVTLPQTVEQARAAALASLTHLDPRLLRADYVSAHAIATAQPEQTTDTDEMRAQIERALYALLNKQ